MSASEHVAANEQVIREGGGQNSNNQQADAVMDGNESRDGLHPPSVIGGSQPAVPSSVSGNLNPSPTSLAEQMAGNKAMPNFGFSNPFAGSAGSATNILPAAASAPSDAASTPRQSTLPLAGFGSDVRLDAPHLIPTNFSTMTAEQILSQFEQLKIQNVPRQAWIDHDLSGAAILDGVAPSLLNEYLLNEVGIKPPLLRDRVVACITKLIIADETLSAALRNAWMQFLKDVTSAYTARATQAHSQLLATPGSIVATATPPTLMSQSNGSGNFGNGGSAASHPRELFPESKKGGSSSFLSEIPKRANFSFDAPARTPMETSFINPGAGSSIVSSAGGLHITLHQASPQTTHYVILEELETNAVYAWLRKNRKEHLVADPANRRPFNTLVSQDVKEEIANQLFRYSVPAVKSWADVTDPMILNVLLGMFGPRNSRDAKERLKAHKFNFNDSTTFQDRFTPKLRKHFNEFKQSLLDFDFTIQEWPTNDKLEHERIVEALMESIPIPEYIIGPDGKTKVSQCANVESIREMIRENKRRTVEEIAEIVIHRFEQNDRSVRADKLLRYAVTPWNTRGAFNARKRKYNPLSTEQEGNANSANSNKKQKTTTQSTNPRCNNCGVKSHICSERLCYLFGHPKAKGANGTWADGEASLRLSAEEWTAWKGQRHEQFYSYAENKDKPKPVGHPAKAGNANANKKQGQGRK
jgi:hypothetical protein